MKKNLLVIGAAVVAIAVAAAAYVQFFRAPAIGYALRLGVPGAHSTERRLAALSMEIVFDQARSRLISRQEDGQIVAWDLKTGRPQVLAHTDSLFGYCRAKRTLIVADKNTVILIDPATADRREVARGTYDYAAWTEDCSQFALAGDDSKIVEVWRATPLARYATIRTEQPVRNGLAISSDGQYVAAAQGSYSDAAGHRTRLDVFSVTGGPAIARSTAIDDRAMILGMWTMAFAPRSPLLLVGSQIDAKSGLRAIAAPSGDISWGHDGFTSYWVRGLAVSPKGDILVSGDEKGMLRGWDVKTGKKLFERRTGLVIQSLSFSDDGKKLAVGLWDSTIGIVDMATLAD